MYFDIDVNIHMTIEDDHVIVTATSLVIFTYKNCNLKQTVKIFFFFYLFAVDKKDQRIGVGPGTGL